MTSKAFVNKGDVVMEFGGRFGTTTCILSRSVGTTGAVISVEPDRNVQGQHLLYNRFRHDCGFHVVLVTVAKKPLYVKENGRKGYGTQTTTRSRKGWAEIPNMMELNEVEQQIGRTVNVALIDCEGCIQSVSETGFLLDQVELVLMEEDAGEYELWHKTLYEKGFDCLWYLKDTADPANAAWVAVRHSMWLKKGSSRQHPPSCEEYAQQTGLSKTPDLFMCATCPLPP
jgi:hypothetical protein